MDQWNRRPTLSLPPYYRPLLGFSLALMAGCQALPQTDVPADAARASGVADAIVIQTDEQPLDADPVGDGLLTPPQAVRLSIRHDPRIQAALARVRVALAEASQTRLLPNPVLNLSWRFPEGGGPAVFETMLSGDLVSLLSKPGQISAADKRLRAAAADAVTSVLDVLHEVQETYAAVQSADAEVAIIENRAAIIQRLRDLADARLRAGEGIRLDVLTLDAQRSEIAVELLQRRLERTEKRLTLSRLIGAPSGAADWKLSPWQPPPPVRAPEAAWLNAALFKRPEIRSHVWELAALGDDLALTALSPFEGGDIGPHAERDASWVVGPDITTPLPIFDFGQHRKAKAQAQQQVARHELLQLRREIIEEVRRAYASYAASRAALDQAQTELLPLQEKRREQAELAYRAGEADLTTLLLAETDLQESRGRLVELQELVTVAMLKLDRAVGGAGVGRIVESSPPTTLPATTRPGLK
ncbi:MAG: TolC family protein [Tepidisphaerales bacterium]